MAWLLPVRKMCSRALRSHAALPTASATLPRRALVAVPSVRKTDSRLRQRCAVRRSSRPMVQRVMRRSTAQATRHSARQTALPLQTQLAASQLDRAMPALFALVTLRPALRAHSSRQRRCAAHRSTAAMAHRAMPQSTALARMPHVRATRTSRQDLPALAVWWQTAALPLPVTETPAFAHGSLCTSGLTATTLKQATATRAEPLALARATLSAPWEITPRAWPTRL